MDDYLNMMGGLQSPLQGFTGAVNLAKGLQQMQAAEQAKAQAEQAAMMRQQKVRAALANPTAEGINGLALEFPDLIEPVKQYWSSVPKAKKEADLSALAGVTGAIMNGRPEVAVASLKARIQADKDAGEESAGAEALLAMIEAGELEQAKGMAALLLGAGAGEDAVKTILGNLTEGKVVSPGASVVTGMSGEVFRAPDKPERFKIEGPGGEQIVEVGGRPGAGAVAGGAPANPLEVAERIITAESGGNPDAKNPNSTASGLGQFTDGTWLATFRKAYPDSKLPDAEVLKQKSNPTLARKLTQFHVADNARALAAFGLPTDAGAIYMAHFLGQEGAKAVLSADPSTPIRQLVSAKAIASNPTILGGGATAGDVRQWTAAKMSGTPAAGPGGRVVFQGAGRKAPSGYEYTADGNLKAIPGGPGDLGRALKPVPPAAFKAIQENRTALSKVEKALREATAYPDAFGGKNYVPDFIMQRADKEGVRARAAVADIGSLVINQRSGAAVSAAEFPRLVPFIPSVRDAPETVLQKLENMRAEIAAMVEEDEGYFSPENGYRPVKSRPKAAAPTASSGDFSMRELP